MARPVEQRRVQHVRNLFRRDDAFATNGFAAALPLGQQGHLGLPHENYRLALTGDLLDAVFGTKLDQPLADPAAPALTGRDLLDDAEISGYIRPTAGSDLALLFGASADDQYWVRSGLAGFAPDAAQRFYLAERYVDAFGNTTTLAYDPNYSLYLRSSTDPLGNTTSIATDTVLGSDRYDYRVLAPLEMVDPNDNHSEIWFDALGLVAAQAAKGKKRNGTWEGDHLGNFDVSLANPPVSTVAQFCLRTDVAEDDQQARDWLDTATTRFVYHLGESFDPQGRPIFGTRMAAACGIAREKHVGQLATNELSHLQVALECSDGGGNVLMKKVQAEPLPGQTGLRWIVNGLTVLNNKGKPVKQHEPAFSTIGFGPEPPQPNGVAILLYYDAAGRLVRSEMPDGTLGRVEFSPWHLSRFDANDTVRESRWYADRGSPDPVQPLPANASAQTRAAWLAAQHSDTASLTILDGIGREVVGVAHNRVMNAAGIAQNETYLTHTKRDTEGKPLWIRDTRGNLVMQYITPPVPNNQAADPGTGFAPGYDIAGNPLFQHSMDAGDRWVVNDAAGQPLVRWDSRGQVLVSGYDELRRPTTLELMSAAQTARILVSLTQYAQRTPDDVQYNRCGRTWRSFDQSGVVTKSAFDFKGNVRQVARRLANTYDVDTNWRPVLALALTAEPNTLLMSETFTRIAEYDALNRATLQYQWHRSGEPVAVYRTTFNQRGLPVTAELTVGATKTPAGHVGGVTTTAITSLTYDARGQRLGRRLGNGVATTYSYDPETFRLVTARSTRPNRPKLQDLRYTYDAGGNIVEIADDAVPVEFFDNTVIEGRKRYAYDALYRLTEASGREHAGQISYALSENWNDCSFRVAYGANDAKAWRNYTQRFTYDGVGNVLVMRHVTLDTSQRWTRQYEYAADSNRLLATGTGSAPVATHYPAAPTLANVYDYNAHGSIVALSHLPQMEWEFTEQLSYISRSAASTGTDTDSLSRHLAGSMVPLRRRQAAQPQARGQTGWCRGGVALPGRTGMVSSIRQRPVEGGDRDAAPVRRQPTSAGGRPDQAKRARHSHAVSIQPGQSSGLMHGGGE